MRRRLSPAYSERAIPPKRAPKGTFPQRGPEGVTKMVPERPGDPNGVPRAPRGAPRVPQGSPEGPKELQMTLKVRKRMQKGP